VSYGSRPRFSAEVNSDAAMCLVPSYGPRASSIKKNLAVLSVQLVTYVPNIREHVFKALDIRVIMGLQDVRADSAINVCKTCRYAATVQWQHYRPLVWYRYSAKRLDDMTSHC
jgi:hypothetical protein